jgi:hypothetical protein
MPAQQLWKLDSPLLRHLSSAPAIPRSLHAHAAPLPPYEHLKQKATAVSGGGGSAYPLTGGEEVHIDAVLHAFEHGATTKDQALALYVNNKVSKCYCSSACFLDPCV